MSDSLVVCDVDPALTEKLRKFRFRKETNNAAILMKIDKERQLVVLEEEFQVGTFHSFLPATFGKPSSVKGPAGSRLVPNSSPMPQGSHGIGGARTQLLLLPKPSPLPLGLEKQPRKHCRGL
uniref:Glia maturation factor gamma n=1 Tax=Chrysemys picta bellii TaxID=8478 RepID=A0A8C3I3W7_CHRPI